MNMLFNNNTAIEPWHTRLYAALDKPLTLGKALASVAHFAGRRARLQAMGDEAAVVGATTALRLSLIKLAGLDCNSVPTLTRKVQVLGRNRAIWAHHELVACLIDAAVATDAAALGLDANEEARLRRSLRGEL